MGLRVNWTEEASARNSRCRLTAARINWPNNDPTQPTMIRTKPNNGSAFFRSFETQEDATDKSQTDDSKNNSHHSQVQPHIAIEDLSEFMADDSLKFIEGEHLYRAASDADDCIAGGMAGGEGVDGRVRWA